MSLGVSPVKRTGRREDDGGGGGEERNKAEWRETGEEGEPGADIHGENLKSLKGRDMTSSTCCWRGERASAPGANGSAADATSESSSAREGTGGEGGGGVRAGGGGSCSDKGTGTAIEAEGGVMGNAHDGSLPVQSC